MVLCSDAAAPSHNTPVRRALRMLPVSGLMLTGAMAGFLVAGTPVPGRADTGAGLRWRSHLDGQSTRAPSPSRLSRRAAGQVAIALEPGTDGGWEVWVDNPLFGPVEALVLDGAPAGRAPRPSSVPALPARVRVPAQRQVLAARLAPSVTAEAAATLQLRAVPGDASATPLDADYRYPLLARVEIAQGWGGAYSHREDEHRHAIDFAAPAGTPVLAARAGIVMQVATGHATETAPEGRTPADGNAVRILHEDGTMALYAHLSDTGLSVRPGQRVRRGETIAQVGSTGFSTGPHLHFAVQVNRGMRLQSLPFRMSGPDGALRLDAPPLAAPPAEMPRPDTLPTEQAR